MKVFADVALPLPLNKTFLYSIPEPFSLHAAAGCRVLVPFRGRTRIGYILRLFRQPPASSFEIKPVSGLIDYRPLFGKRYLRFILNLSKTFYSPAGELLHSSFPSAFKVKIKNRIELTQAGREALRKESGDSRILKVLRLLENRGYNRDYFIKKLGKKGRTAVDSLIQKKWAVLIREIKTAEDESTPPPPSSFQMEMSFSDGSSLKNAEPVLEAVEHSRFSPFLLKADSLRREEVYFLLIRKTLSRSRAVVFLQPEIDLTRSFQEKWEKRLGENMVILHSRLGRSEKKKMWSRIQLGHAKIVAGPRSALLTPVPRLGLIIVDEAQDSLYYQKESPVYDARKGAWLRAAEERAAVVYGSEFPRVEDMRLAEEKSCRIEIPPGPGSDSAEVCIVDHSDENLFLNKITLEHIQKGIQRKQTVLVFSNRRGYASLTACRRCRHIPRCQNCDIPLMFNKQDGSMVCRYCRYAEPNLRECPQCGSRIIVRKGWGAEALAEYLKKQLPGKNIECFFSDVFSGGKEKDQCLERYKEGKIDVFIGTRMLARYISPRSAPRVIVLCPETLMSLPDFRAGQKTFEYITSLKKLISGGPDSCFVVQTAYPRHHAVESAARGDYLSFYSQEIRYRRLLNYPPFTIMAEILFQDRNARTAARRARAFSRRVQSGFPEVELLGPSKSSLFRLRGRYRIHVLVKSRSRKELDKIFSDELSDILTRASVRIYE